MKITRKYINYSIPGAFFAETSSKEVDSFDIPKEMPADVYAFNFSETDYVVEGKEEFVGKTRHIGPTYYIGKAIPVDKIPDVDENGRGNDILKRNIKSNSPTKTGIKCHTGNWQMVDKNTKVLSESQFKWKKALFWEGYN